MIDKINVIMLKLCCDARRVKVVIKLTFNFNFQRLSLIRREADKILFKLINDYKKDESHTR